MRQYLQLLQTVLEQGEDRLDRTGTGTRGVFGAQARYNLQQGFPLLTTKKLHWHSIVGELLWFIRGETNVKWLQERKIRIWDEWANEKGDLGPVYGAMWRRWPQENGETIDQLAQLIEQLRIRPYSRRHLISAWNPALLPDEGILPHENPALGKQALPPCHCLCQFSVREGRLSCLLYQRSADLFLGVPFNLASYSLLTLLLAEVVGLKPGEFIHSFGDLHLYTDHLELAELQLLREPHALPEVEILRPLQNLADLEALEIEEVQLKNYQHHPHIKAKVSV